MKKQVRLEDFYTYIKEIFNIKNESILINVKIDSSIMKLPDPVKFINYAHENIGNEKYDYKTGYQKFLLIYADYRKTIIKSIPEKNIDILSKFIENTYKLICNIFDEIYYKLQVTGKNFFELNLEKTFEKNMHDKQIKLCRKTGKWENLFAIYVKSPEKLKNRLYESAFELAIEKKYPSLAIEKNKNSRTMKR